MLISATDPPGSFTGVTESNFTRVRRFGFINCYLVEEDDGLTVVDTAMRATKIIERHARERDLPIRRILLTHAHDDHVGSVDALLANNPDAELIISARDARLMAGDRSLDPNEPQDKLQGGLSGQKSVPTRLINEGDMVGSLRAIATPGHTPGHLAYVDQRDGTLFSGDVFSTWGGTATSAVRNPRFPLVFMGTWHPPTVIESARKLAELEPSRLAPGHGGVLEAPGPAMLAAVERDAARAKPR